MEPVRSIAVKGLMEGLVLHAIEREPTHGYGILKDLESALGDRPGKNQIYPLLRELEDEGYVEAETAEDGRTKQVYHLTEEGHDRLASYRSLPPPFKNWLASVFGLPHLEAGREPAAAQERAPEDEPAHERPSEPTPPDEEPGPRPRAPRPAEAGWVARVAEELPPGAEVKAPHAEISVERTPRTGTWSLTIRHHEPGRYEGAEACPLTFLYLAMQRLLFETPVEPPDDTPDQPR